MCNTALVVNKNLKVRWLILVAKRALKGKSSADKMLDIAWRMVEAE